MRTGFVLCNPVDDSKYVIAMIHFATDTKTNIGRDYMYDRNYALHRCNKAHIITIFDPKNRDIRYSEAVTVMPYASKQYKLKIGTIFICDDWVKNSCKETYGPGLLFTLTEEAIHGYIPEYERHGVYRYWSYKNGRLVIHAHYDNGKRIGTFSNYDPSSGKLIEITDYKDGKKHGLSRRWKDEVLIEECRYVDGLLHGHYVFYIDNVLRKSAYYDHGKLYGLYVLNNSDGSVSLSAHYKDNLLDGIKCIHDAKGSLIRIETYQKGILHGPYKTFIDGKINTEVEYLNGKFFAICL